MNAALSRRAAVAASLAALGLGLAATCAPRVVRAVEPAASAAEAALIARAGRLAALARRCHAVAAHECEVADRVSDLCPDPTPLPKPPIPDFISETPTATGRVLHIRQDREIDPAWVRWEADTAAEKAAHERREAETGALLGLPEVKRRSERMRRRRDRWAADLAGAEPRTAAGLGAKAGALLAMIGKGRLSREEGARDHADLVAAVLADAVRLGVGGVA